MPIKTKVGIKGKDSTENLKIVYLSNIRLTDRVAHNWFIDDLLHKGIDVEFWDLIPFMREHHREFNEISPKYLKELNSIIELDELIKKQTKEVVYVVLFPLNNATKNVYIKLSNQKARIVYIDWGAMPIYTTSTQFTKIKRFVGAFRSLNHFKLVLQSRYFLLLQKLKIIKKFDIFFASGRILEEKPRHAEKVVSIPFADYIEYKKAEKNSKTETSRYAVFLDINLPFQSDLALAGMPQINPEIYYSEMNSFFDMIEVDFNVKVVIAAHPKNSLNLQHFSSRTAKRMKTAELVRDAEFVISHQSTSISYAVLNYKPLMFIYTPTMELLYKSSIIVEIKNLAQYFGSDPINSNSSLDSGLISLPQVNKPIYDKYIEYYIASKNSQQSSPSYVFLSEIINLIKCAEIK
jgi:hypothetical protein